MAYTQELSLLLEASPPLVDDPGRRALDLVASELGVPFRWQCPGIYCLRVVDPESALHGAQYVGKSVNVRRRVMQHLWGSGDAWGTSALPREQWPLKSRMEGRALSLFFSGISSRDLALAEAYWVRLLRPELNAGSCEPATFGRHRYGNSYHW